MPALDVVQSATGPIGPDELGLTLPHEHVFIHTFPRDDGHMVDWEERKTEIDRFRALGGRTILDVSNGELGTYAAPIGFDADPAHGLLNATTGSRSVANVLATRAMAQATGVTIVLGTGHYHQQYFDAGWFDRNATEAIAEFLVADLEEGFPGTGGVRAGFIGEVGANRPYITAQEERSFRAAGRAAARTGVMVTTHAPTFPTADAQIDILVSEGVDPSRIVIGHTDTVKHLQHSIDLLQRGVYIEYDCMMAVRVGGRIVPHELQRRVGHLAALIERGYGDRILLSHDVGRQSHQADRGGPGLTFIFAEFATAAIAAGIAPDALRRLSTDNPRRALFGA